jgi:polysaccharide pyruvyl transferase CsaB
MDKLKILIIGYYGANNTGDEILLKSTIKLLKSIYKSSEIKAITYNVENTELAHGIRGISRNKFAAIINEVKKSDIVVGGGGSMIQNVTSNRSLIYYLTILKIAKLFNKKVFLLGNGIGPIKGSFPLKMTVDILKSIDAIILRDKDSFKLLDSKGLQNIYLGNDLAFNLDYEKVLDLHPVPRKIAINLRNWTYKDDFLYEMKRFVRYLVEKDYTVVFIPFQKGNDDLILKEILASIKSNKIRLVESEDCEVILKEIASSEIFIGMRLHGLIFSSIVNTPFIGLTYDPKVSSFSEGQGQPYFKTIEEIDFPSLKHKFENMYKHREYYKNLLKQSTDKILDLSVIYKSVLSQFTDKGD